MTVAAAAEARAAQSVAPPLGPPSSCRSVVLCIFLREGLHPHVREEEPYVGEVLAALAQALGVQVPPAPAGGEAEHLHPHALDHPPHLLLVASAQPHEIPGERPGVGNDASTLQAALKLVDYLPGELLLLPLLLLFLLVAGCRVIPCRFSLVRIEHWQLMKRFAWLLVPILFREQQYALEVFVRVPEEAGPGPGHQHLGVDEQQVRHVVGHRPAATRGIAGGGGRRAVAVAVEAEVRGEVPEEDALVERRPQAPLEVLAAAAGHLAPQSPLAPAVVEGPRGGRVRHVALPAIFEVAVDEVGDVAGGGVARLHAPEVVEVVPAGRATGASCSGRGTR